MEYLKEQNTFDIPESFEQAFFRDPMLVTDLTQVMMLKQRGVIDKTDIKILELIYELKFSTIQQLETYANMIGMEKDELDARLAVLFSNTIINKFGLVDEEKYKGALPGDIKVFYCLHTGGKQLLDAYSGEDYIDWVPGYVFSGAKGVIKIILAGELYLQFIKSNKEFISHVRKPHYNLKNAEFFGGDEFCLKINNKPTYFISDIFLASDKNNVVKQKLRNYETVFASKGWKRYYLDGEKIPTLLFITENDGVASSLAGTISEFYHFPGPCLFSTKDRLLRGITTEGSFFYHDRVENKLRKTCLEALV